MKPTLSQCLGRAMAIAFLALPAAGNVTVTTLTDENNGSLDPGLGSGTSLREAVAHAAAGSVIDFAPALSGQTIVLGSQISFGKNFTLDAANLAAGVTVSGNDSTRVFDIPASRTVAMTRLKIVKGDSSGDGGGIRNAGTLSLTDCELGDNQAGDGGGAIGNSGPLTLTACTLAGNHADAGGGAIEHTANVLTLINCTLTGNTAEFGGAIDGDGSSTIHLRSCTITGNHATNDGGGIEETSGTLLLENTIIAGNSATDQGPDLKASGINIQSGVNLISSSDGLGGSFSGIFGAPRLSPLGNHGGPTRTMPPLAGSPAINAGGTTTLIVDQRGLPRVSGGAVDIGAAEVQVAPMVTSTADAGPGSLRQAVQDAPAGTTLTFAPALDGSTITLASPIVLAKNLTLDAAALGSLEIAGGDATGLFTVNAGVLATMRDLKMRDGSRASGGAIANAGQLALVECSITSSFALDGGAISNGTDAVLSLTDCELAGNIALYHGGGLHNQGTLTLTRVTVSNNHSGEDFGAGGGAYSTGSLSLTDSLVSGNTSLQAGGIYSSGTLALTRVTVSGNSTFDGSAGGILVRGNGGSIVNSTMSGNSCPGSGGAVFHDAGNLTITNSTFAGNSSVSEYGGAIAAHAPGAADLLGLVSCTIANNEASEEGGGVHIMAGSRLRLENSIVAGNSATTAGPDIRGAIETQAGVNLVTSTSGIDGSFAGIVASPLLGALSDNGGRTWTMLPQSGSPAIDAGGTTTSMVDQRGLPRVSGPAADIGAVELSRGGSGPATRPLGLTLTAKSANSLSLAWDVPGVDTSLAGYNVYLDGLLAGSPASNAFVVPGLDEDRSYNVQVRARDLAGNLSAPSNVLLATPQAGGLQAPAARVRTEFRAIVLNYNPHIVANGGLVRADTHYGNRNVDELIHQYIELMRKASGGQMNWIVTDRFDLDEWAPPSGTPEEVYTPHNCVALVNEDTHYPASYTAIVHDPRFGIVERANQGELDAVWVFGARGLDFFETSMVGPTAFYINGAAIPDGALDENIVFYGFGKAGGQSVGFMCENTAHMAEVIMHDRFEEGQNWPLNVATQTFNTLNFENPSRALINTRFADWTHFVQAEASSWDRDLVAPGRSQCGLSHYPPTALYNYNWSTFLHEFNGTDPFVPIDGSWGISGGELHAVAGNGVKTLARDIVLHEPGVAFQPVQAFSDADVEFSLRVMNGATSSHAGFLFRVFAAAAGTDQAKGYFLGLNANQDQVVLAKLDNAFIPLATASLAVNAGTTYRLRLEARGSQLRVYLGTSLTPLISISDTSYITGGFGFCTYGTEAYFDQLDIVTHVVSKADKWYRYPAADAEARDLTPLDWDGDTPQAMDGFYAWWWEHLPKNGGGHHVNDLNSGEPTLLLNSWWPYIYDHNRFDSTQPFPDIVFAPEDVSAPSPVTGLEALALSGSEVVLAWEPAADDVGVTRYTVYRDGQFLRKTASSYLNDTRLGSGSTHTYGIVACDGSGNASAPVVVDVTTFTSDAPGFVIDGNFEFPDPEAAGWLTGAFRPDDALFAWVPGGGRNGSAAVSVDATNFNDAGWSQLVHGLQPGATYWLTGWIKGEGIEPDIGETLGANLCLVGGFEHSGPLIGTFDWQRVSMSFVAPASGSVTIGCRIGFYGNLTRGKAWFDDIAIVRHPFARLTEPELLSDGHFRCVLLSPSVATYTLERSPDLIQWTFVRTIPALHPDTEILENFELGAPWFYRATDD